MPRAVPDERELPLLADHSDRHDPEPEPELEPEAFARESASVVVDVCDGSPSISVTRAASPDEDSLCVVCFELPSGSRLPCGHDEFCDTCAAKFDTCPLCRAPTGRVRPTLDREAAAAARNRERRLRMRYGGEMQRRGSATCFGAVCLLMAYTCVLFVLDTIGVDIRCDGLPLLPGGSSADECKEVFGDAYGKCSRGVCLMAPAYVLSDCADDEMCGTYLRTNAECAEAPVYLRNGRIGEKGKHAGGSPTTTWISTDIPERMRVCQSSSGSRGLRKPPGQSGEDTSNPGDHTVIRMHLLLTDCLCVQTGPDRGRTSHLQRGPALRCLWDQPGIPRPGLRRCVV